MAKRYSKAAHAKRHKQTSHKIKNVIILIFLRGGYLVWLFTLVRSTDVADGSPR